MACGVVEMSRFAASPVDGWRMAAETYTKTTETEKREMVIPRDAPER